MNQHKEKWRVIITKCTLLWNWERHTQRMWKQMSFTQFWQPGHFCLLKKAAIMQIAGSLSCRTGVASGTEFARPQGFKVSILWKVMESFYMAKVRVMSIFNQQNILWIHFAFCAFICSQKPSKEKPNLQMPLCQHSLLLYISVICTTATKVKKNIVQKFITILYLLSIFEVAHFT